MFLSSSSFSSPAVTFTFADPGLGILDSFKTHLLAYGSLFEALPEVRLVYVSPRPTQFEAAISGVVKLQKIHSSSPVATELICDPEICRSAGCSRLARKRNSDVSVGMISVERMLRC